MESSTQVLRKLLDERGVRHEDEFLKSNIPFYDGLEMTEWNGGLFSYVEMINHPPDTPPDAPDLTIHNCTPQQAIAATLGDKKAKAHPYGYEPDTGAFDATRCECGCVNDISATYCNDCGGEIEIDMNAEKEIYHTPRHMVFAEKHDDGSLEFCERRYVPEDAATLGKPMTDANLEQALSFMRIWISEDAHLGESELSAAFEKAEGLRKLDAIESAIAATLGGGECEIVHRNGDWYCTCCNEMVGSDDPWSELLVNGNAIELWRYCPNCGKVVKR